MSEKNNFPRKSKGDYVHSLAKAVVGSVPVAGSFLAEFIDNVVMPPYERRKKEWMQEVANRMEEIKNNKNEFNLDDLSANIQFQDAIYSATKSAMATSNRVKLDSLLNTLQNVALKKSTDEIENALFLNLIDRFTEIHIRICVILGSPNDYRENRGEYETKEKYRELIHKKIPNASDELIDLIINDLYNNRLIDLSANRINEYPPINDEGKSWLTDFGISFLEFIKKPDIV